MGHVDAAWPEDPDKLRALQDDIASLSPPRWEPSGRYTVGGVFVAFPTGIEGAGGRGDAAWGATAVYEEGRRVDRTVLGDEADAPYRPGLFALREGRLLQRTAEALRRRPDVLLVNATGRDHPRRAGLALHLGWALEVPTIGVTHRPLVASGRGPRAERGAWEPLRLDGDVVGAVLRTRADARPLFVHAAWRTDPETAAAVVLGVCGDVRTPEPLREARRLAREARASGEGRLPGRPRVQDDGSG